MEDDIDRKEPRNKALEEYTEGFLTSHGVIFSSDFRSPKKRRGKLISSRDRRRERMIYSRGPRVVDKAEDAEDSTNTQNSQNSSNNSFDRNDNRETDFSAGSVSVSAGGGSGGPRASGARGVSQGNAAENHRSFLSKSDNSNHNNQQQQYRHAGGEYAGRSSRARPRDLAQASLSRGNSPSLGQGGYSISGKQTTLHANDVYCGFLHYDHLSSHSFDTIEVSPNRVPRQKNIAYVSRWWHGAKKWGVLSDELLKLENELVTPIRSGVGEGRLPYAPSQSPPVPLISRELYEAVRAHCGKYKARVICVGDVHGCADELHDLLCKVRYRPCDVVVLLGDLVAKGPRSIDVIQMAMDINAMSVRGNHDQEVIRRSVTWRTSRHVRSTEKVKHNEHTRIAKELTPAQWSWLTELPYFVRSDDLSALFVHAGFQANLRLTDQDPWVMMTMRSLLPGHRASARCDFRFPWASLWKGPMTVYFGHDAARGLQIYNHAVGLDTGCVYGAELTSMILPEKEVVAVRAHRPYQDMKKSRSHKSLAATDPHTSNLRDKHAQSGAARTPEANERK